MSNAFAPILRARPNPIFGRPVHQGSLPFDYSPILLLKPFGFQIAPDTLSSSERTRWPARHYPHLWIQRPSFERRRDLNPPDSCAAQRTICPLLTSAPRSTLLSAGSVRQTGQRHRSPEVSSTAFTAHPPNLPPRSLMTVDFAISCSLVRPGRPAYPVLVHRVAALLHASFRPCLAATPLRFANPSPPSGWVEDFHLQAVDHARHTTKNGGVSPAVSLVFSLFAISAGAEARSAATGWPAPARRPRSTGGSTAPGCWPLPGWCRPGSGWTNRSAAR